MYRKPLTKKIARLDEKINEKCYKESPMILGNSTCVILPQFSKLAANYGAIPCLQ